MGQMGQSYFPKDLKALEHEKNKFAEARQLLVSQSSESIQKYHSDLHSHRLVQADTNKSDYSVMEYTTSTTKKSLSSKHSMLCK